MFPVIWLRRSDFPKFFHHQTCHPPTDSISDNPFTDLSSPGPGLSWDHHPLWPSPCPQPPNRALWLQSPNYPPSSMPMSRSHFAESKPNHVPTHMKTILYSVPPFIFCGCGECGGGPAICHGTARQRGSERKHSHTLISEHASLFFPLEQCEAAWAVFQREGPFSGSHYVYLQGSLSLWQIYRSTQKQGSGPGKWTTVVCGRICECAQEPHGW